jgi:multicomponent Na+:H+ antiporter subunit G
MTDILAAVAVVLGAMMGLLSAIGIVRMPDTYIRLSVASKASSLGIALLMIGVAAHFDELAVTIRALLVVVFLFLTAPVAAHVIGRAAYIAGVPLAAGSEPDELAGRYDVATGRLAGPGSAVPTDVEPSGSTEAVVEATEDGREAPA